MRRWWWLAGVAASTLVPACSSDGAPGGEPTTSFGATFATVPDDAEPGTAVLVLAGVAHRFTVTCGVDTTPTAPGVTTLFALHGTGDEDDVTLSALRQETQGATVTTTDTITFIAGGIGFEAQRVAFGGAFVDLREEGVDAPLLEIDGSSVRAHGRFGPPGATVTSPDLSDGDLVARCP